MNQQDTQEPRRASRSFPEALRNFDSLPNSAHVRQPVVEGLFSCSPASVWRRVKDGTIPAPKKYSARVTVWNVGDLRRALAADTVG